MKSDLKMRKNKQDVGKLEDQEVMNINKGNHWRFLKNEEVGQRENLEVRKNKSSKILARRYKRVQTLNKYRQTRLKDVQEGLKGGENMITISNSFNN